jgi:glycosyltransferase involved in cell wall biosynthesis
MPAMNVPSTAERIPISPPVIVPVSNHISRPLWSVMIPAYNCFAYLRETLESVLVQNIGPELMQIVVVDDCSTDGDVFGLVQAVGKGRIDYFKQEVNVGSLRNFETCLNLSIGKWIHILHGDDKVLHGFYAEIAMLFRNHPEAGAAFTNNAILTINDEGEKVEPRPLLAEEAGVIKNFLFMIAAYPRLETPSIVVKRIVYEQLGGFFAVHYGEDWEMWVRIASHFPVAYSPKCLAHYRYLNNASITRKSIKTGQNILDVIKVIDITQNYLPFEMRKKIKRNAFRDYSKYCVSLTQHLYYTDRRAAFVQANGALRMNINAKVVYMTFMLCLKTIIQYDKIKRLWLLINPL